MRTVTHIKPRGIGGMSTLPRVYFGGSNSVASQAILANAAPPAAPGTMRLTIPQKGLKDATLIKPGMWLLMDAVFTYPLSFHSGKDARILSVNAYHSGSFAAGNVSDISYVDFHADKCGGLMWNVAGGMTTVRGVYRWWHSSLEAAMDDSFNSVGSKFTSNLPFLVISRSFLTDCL